MHINVDTESVTSKSRFVSPTYIDRAGKATAAEIILDWYE